MTHDHPHPAAGKSDMASMLAVSLAVFALTGSAEWAAISQVLVALVVGHLSVNRYIRREGWKP